MYSILFFALRRRFTSYVSNTESVLSLILRILFFIVLLINAALVGWLIDIMTSSETKSLDPDEFIRVTNTTICGLWALLAFFPTYYPRSNIVSSVFPIPFKLRWVANLVYDTVIASTLVTVVAFCLVDAFSTTYTHTHLANSLLLFANTIVFVQLIKAFAEASHRYGFLVMSAWALLVGISVLLMLYQSPDGFLLMGGLGLCLINQLALLAYADRTIVDAANSSVAAGSLSLSRRLSPVYAAFLNNPKSRSAFGLGLFLKTALLFCMGLPFMKSSPMNAYLQMLYISPLILFTYVANNIWGFFPALWANTTFGKRSTTYRIYIQLISLPVLIDLLITLGILLYQKDLEVNVLIFYALSTIAFGVNGLVFSIYKPFYVHSSFNFGQMKNNVNGWSIFTAFVLFGLTALSLKTALTTLLFGLSVIAGSWYLICSALPHTTTTTYTLYKKLFSSRD